jgi:hypothetical protein
MGTSKEEFITVGVRPGITVFKLTHSILDVALGEKRVLLREGAKQ